MFGFFKRRKEEAFPPPEQVYPPPDEIPPQVLQHLQHLRSERLFPISETESAVLDAFTVHLTMAGVFAPEDIARKLVMDGLKARAERTFGVSSLYVHTPPPGKLPYFTCMALMSANPMGQSFYCSYLTVCWFQDELPRNIYTTVGEKVYGVDWRKYAEDGFE